MSRDPAAGSVAPGWAAARRVVRQGGTLRLTVFGSSTTAGYGASDPGRTGYAAVMRTVMAASLPGGIAVTNLGVSGECIEEMAPRVADVVASRPDLVVWQSGSNDAPRGVTIERFETLMQAGIDAMLGTGGAVVLMEPQWCSALEALPEFPAFLASMRGLAARNGLALHPRYALMQDWGRETGLGIDGLSPDGTHMGDVGYAMLGSSVAEFLLDRLVGRPDGAVGEGS